MSKPRPRSRSETQTPCPMIRCRVGIGRVIHVSVVTFPHAPLRTGLAPFSASGSPVLRWYSGELATNLTLWVAYLPMAGSAERDEIV